MEYRVAVGERIFGIYNNKNMAIEVAEAASHVFMDKDCRLVYKNLNNFKGTPVYRNGKEI